MYKKKANDTQKHSLSTLRRNRRYEICLLWQLCRVSRNIENSFRSIGISYDEIKNVGFGYDF